MPAAAAVAACTSNGQRRRYDQIMGNLQPRVTDKLFVAELRSRLDEYYLTGLRTKEVQLADAEKRREMRLTQDDRTQAPKTPTALQKPRRRRTSSARKRRAASSRRLDRDEGGEAPGDCVEEWTGIWPPNPDKANTSPARDIHEQQQMVLATGATENDDDDEGDEEGSGLSPQQSVNAADLADRADQLLIVLSVDQLYSWASNVHKRRVQRTA